MGEAFPVGGAVPHGPYGDRSRHRRATEDQRFVPHRIPRGADGGAAIPSCVIFHLPFAKTNRPRGERRRRPAVIRWPLYLRLLAASRFRVLTASRFRVREI